MKNLLLLLCLAAPCLAEEKKFTYEELRLLDPLPDYVYAMPRATYIEWGKFHNDGAFASAAAAAQAFRDKTPYSPTYISTTTGSIDSATLGDRDNSYCGDTTLDTYLSRTYFTSSTTFRTFEDRNAWGGGPVVIINPYAKRPPKIIVSDGMKYLADPDNTIKDPTAAKLFLENN